MIIFILPEFNYDPQHIHVHKVLSSDILLGLSTGIILQRQNRVKPSTMDAFKSQCREKCLS